MFEKSHIHILDSETLSRESRITESAQEIVGSIHYNCKLNNYVYLMSTLLFYCWEDVLQEVGKVSAGNTKYAEHYISYGYSFRIYVNFEEILK